MFTANVFKGDRETERSWGRALSCYAGLIAMTRAAAAPALAECMPEFAPPQLPIESCPKDFASGWTKTSKKRKRSFKRTHTRSHAEDVTFFVCSDTRAQAI